MELKRAERMHEREAHAVAIAAWAAWRAYIAGLEFDEPPAALPPERMAALREAMILADAGALAVAHAENDRVFVLLTVVLGSAEGAGDFAARVEEVLEAWRANPRPLRPLVPRTSCGMVEERDPETSAPIYRMPTPAEQEVLSGARIVDAPLFCTRCGAQHVDEGEWAQRPHRTHLCRICGQHFDVTVRGAPRPL